MQQIKLLQVDPTTFNSLPSLYGVPQFFMVGGNGQIKLWPQPSVEAISAGLRITFDLTSSEIIISALLASTSASAATLSFNLDPPLSIFSGPLGVLASTSYLETIADNSPCWWLFVGAYNAQPQPTPLAYRPDPPPFIPQNQGWEPPTRPSAPIPEASTWAMVLAGLTGIAAKLWRAMHEVSTA